MKKFEFKNYFNHRTAEVMVNDVDPWGYFVCYTYRGRADSSIPNTTAPGNGVQWFATEDRAVKAAFRYVG